MKTHKLFSTLFWKISITFFSILLLLSSIYTLISVDTVQMYFQEASQKLNLAIAPHIVSDYKCFHKGKPNQKELKKVFHDVMIINPSLELYMLDTEGKILTYYAPKKKIKLEYVPLGPINKCLNSREKKLILGADPKNPGREKAFSAAKIYEEGIHRGYIYVILGSEEYESTLQLILGSYIIRLGLGTMGVTLFAAFSIGLIALGLITRNIKKIIIVIRKFKNGDLSARIDFKGRGELIEFATSYNEMADTIVNNIEKIKILDTNRRKLIANISHDLRTPLATIQGYVETIMLKKDILSDVDKEKYIETILRSTVYLRKMVDDLFELSKFEAKEIKPNPEVFSIAELLQDIYQKNLIIAESTGIKLSNKFPKDLPFIFTDLKMLEQVIQNLLDNAFKFTPEGGKVILSLEKYDSTVVFNIEDSGSGISEENLDYIFDRYHRAAQINFQRNSGLGLGLTIVKKILDLQNIRYTVSSEKNVGTKFSLKLPIAEKYLN